MLYTSDTSTDTSTDTPYTICEYPSSINHIRVVRKWHPRKAYTVTHSWKNNTCQTVTHPAQCLEIQKRTFWRSCWGWHPRIYTIKLGRVIKSFTTKAPNCCLMSTSSVTDIYPLIYWDKIWCSNIIHPRNIPHKTWIQRFIFMEYSWFE